MGYETLLHAKLYDAQNAAFLRSEPIDRQRPSITVKKLTQERIGATPTIVDRDLYDVNLRGLERPDELQMELLFYDSRTFKYLAPQSASELTMRRKTARQCSSAS